jgi:hypothetical protein
MIFLLWLSAFNPDPTQSIADPAQRRAAQICEASLSRKAGGEISSFDVAQYRRAGRETMLDGTTRVLRKPVTRPGEMTPTHVIVVRYSYRCRLSGRDAPRIMLHPLSD